MSKLLKSLVIGLGGLLLVLFFVAGLAVALFDPNAFKTQIVDAVKSQTGRELRIDAPIDLKLFPWLAVSLGKVSLSNAPGFGDAPLVRVDEVRARVKLLPLLSRRVEADSLVVRGLELNLDSAESTWRTRRSPGATSAAAAVTRSRACRCRLVR